MFLRRTCAVAVALVAAAAMLACSNTSEGLFPERDAAVADAPSRVDAREPRDAAAPDAAEVDAAAGDAAPDAAPDAAIDDAGAGDAAAFDAVR